MRRKNLFRMLLVFMFINCLTLVKVNFASHQQSALTIISINPEESVCDVGQYFTINISIADVWNLSIWKFDLSYDDGVLYTNQSMIVVDPYEWFSQGGSIPDFPSVRVTPGNITVSDLLLDEKAGTSGNGTLAKVTFRVQATGNSTLHLHHTILYNLHWSPIDHTLDDGFFRTPPAIISVSPATNVHNPGDYFTINISIANVTNLNMWGATLNWDPSILKCIYVIEGPFLSDAGPTNFLRNIMPGQITMGCSLTVPVGANGNGTLATIQFQVLNPGRCELDLHNTELYDIELKPIPHTPQDGVFYTTKPVAFFTYSPKDPNPWDLVTFDASDSYDPNGVITTYFWDFGDGSNETGPHPKKVVVTHLYEESWSSENTTFTVKLTITDNETETATYTDTIKVEKNVAIESIGLTAPDYSPYFKKIRSGSVVEIPVTVVNYGTMTEDFQVELYYNGTSLPDNPTSKVFNPLLIGTQRVDDLWGTEKAGANTTRELTFKWNTTGVSDGNYTFMANIPWLPSESDFEDNLMIAYTSATVWHALVEVSGKAGDVNGDGEVDWKDLLIFARAYGSSIGEPGYVPEADFDSSGKIDWRDLLVLALNYGKDP